MRMGTRAVAVCAVVCLHAGTAAAQGRVMTLAEVLARAREQAPQIVSARLALEEARGRLLGASVRFQANPEIDAALGNRNGPDTRFTDFELGLGQSFEPGARRSARIAGANAAIAQSSANIDEVTRTVLRLAASAYYRAVHANERIKLLNATHELAQSVYATADRRFKAGDIAVLDVNIARASLGARQGRTRRGGSLEGIGARRAAAASASRDGRRCGRLARASRRDRLERGTSDSALSDRSFEDSKPPSRKPKPSCGSASVSRSPNTASASGTREKKAIRSSSAA